MSLSHLHIGGPQKALPRVKIRSEQIKSPLLNFLCITDQHENLPNSLSPFSIVCDER